MSKEKIKLENKINQIKKRKEKYLLKAKNNYASNKIAKNQYNKRFDHIVNEADAGVEILTTKLEELKQKEWDRENDKTLNKLEGNKAHTLKAINKANTSPIKKPVKEEMLSDENIMEIRNVHKTYVTGKIGTPVLNGINFEIKKGEFIMLFGKSGSGKSTLLNVMSGLDRVTKGEIVSLSQNISAMKEAQITKFRRHHVGFIFQKYNLLPNLNAYENAETGSYLQKDRSKRVPIEDIFESMDIKDVMYKYPSEMSGGQQQRVSIARALAKNPEILFADEPTGALDEKMTLVVLEILAKINKEYNTTIIMVTHNPILAEMATKVVTLRNGYIESIKVNKNPKDPRKLKW